MLEIIEKIVYCNWVTVIGLCIVGSMCIAGFFVVLGKTPIPVINPQNNFGVSILLLVAGIVMLGVSSLVAYIILK